jgi:septum formation protein
MLLSPLSIVLGSRSPRRRELLGLIVPPESILVLPPSSSEEQGFGDCHTLEQIKERIQSVVSHKHEDVLQQVSRLPNAAEIRAVVSADTIVIAFDHAQQPLVMGQPPENDQWQSTVREWFLNYYLGKEHLVMTAVKVTIPGGASQTEIATARLVSPQSTAHWLEWYLATGESRGKAGGYGLQGGGSMFFDQVTGEITTVIGLPIATTKTILDAFGLT